MLRSGTVVPLFVFLFVLGYRDGIDAGQPAMQVDVGAALGAERLEHLVHGLAADGAEFAVFGFRHDRNMGHLECCANPFAVMPGLGRKKSWMAGTSPAMTNALCPCQRQTVLSQPKWIG